MPSSTISNTSFLSRFSSKSATAGKMYKCTVQMLDDSETVTIEFKVIDRLFQVQLTIFAEE